MQGPDLSRPPAPECACADRSDRPVTRRAFVGVTAGAIAATPLWVSAQSTPEGQQPVATPAGESAIDQEALARVSLAVVGGGSFAALGLETLGGLISADPDRVAAFDELAGLDDPSSDDALEAMSGDARSLVDDIVQFWYLGYFDGKPVENRAELYFSLPVWGTVPYAAQPTLCKAFGYWAMDVTLE